MEEPLCTRLGVLMSAKVTKEEILKDYNKLVSLAEKYFAKKQYERSVTAIKTAALLMYNFNLIYTDERLESLLHKIADVYIPQLSIERTDKAVLFYDWWGWETRGLSNIYIKALLANGYKVIVVTPNQNKNTTSWLKELLGENEIIEFYDTKASCKKQLEELANIYNKYKPSFTFFHSMPNDVTGCSFFAKIPCTRYQINLTDHAYWLGATCLDYSIEFRDYGYSISKRHRHIPEEKLLVLPYYPVHKMVTANSMKEFFEAHKNIVFSGGALYKIAGSPVFFEIVSYILDTYKDSTFVFIGGGNPESINNFISQKGYQDRFFYFTERPDFEDFIRHSKFFLCTYPIMGALMNQLAVINGKIPLCYNPNMDGIARDGDNESLFIDTGHNPIMSYQTLDELKHEIDRLFSDNDYLSKKENQLEGMIITETDFAEQVRNILGTNSTKYAGHERKLNLEEFSQIYIDAENNTNKLYNIIFAQTKSSVIYRHFPVKCFYGVAKFFLGRIKK